MAETGKTATARIQPKKQTLEDAYSPPANFLEIDVVDPQTHGVAKKRYTDYEVKIKVWMDQNNTIFLPETLKVDNYLFLWTDCDIE